MSDDLTATSCVIINSSLDPVASGRPPRAALLPHPPKAARSDLLSPENSPAAALCIVQETTTTAPLRCPGEAKTTKQRQQQLLPVLKSSPQQASPLILRIIASAPGVPVAPVIHAAAAEALVEACRMGGARAALCARELARPPLCAHSGPRGLLIDALCAACGSSSLEAIRVLASAPYSLSREDALLRGRSGKCAVDCACESGSVDALEALAQPPFNVCRDDLLRGHLGVAWGMANLVGTVFTTLIALDNFDIIAYSAMHGYCPSM
eukprot:m51a1_g14653 hypothetical protein (266) ;mRNA; r:114411-123018